MRARDNIFEILQANKFVHLLSGSRKFPGTLSNDMQVKLSLT